MSLNVSKTFKSSPYSLLFIVFSILCLGLISLFSVADSRSVDDSNAFLRQLIFLGPAIILMFLFIIIPKKIIHEYVYIFYGAVVVFVVLPYFSAKVADTHRWIDIGLPFSLQPSEIAKYCNNYYNNYWEIFNFDTIVSHFEIFTKMKNDFNKFKIHLFNEIRFGDK